MEERGGVEARMPWGLKSPRHSSLTLPFRKKNRYVINEPDPTYQVTYLGNVLTMMAKGDNCVEKPLALIWKTHLGRTRPDLPMKLSVAKSGLKAETKLQGLTEYWAHRITFCLAPPGYPRVFCWIYKHEGKKMKPELRCHAVLCKRATEPVELTSKLSFSLTEALREYRREKLSRQNTRLSAIMAGQPLGLPLRKQMLSTGTSNFRPPMSRSKSAPKLGMIEEDQEDEEDEEEEEEDDETLTNSLATGSEEGSLHSSDCVVEGLSEGMGDSPRSSGSDFPRLSLEEDPTPPLRHRHPPLPLRRPLSADPEQEADSISDESGYHESASDDGFTPPLPNTAPKPDPNVTVTAF